MLYATIVTTIILAATLMFAAFRKLSHAPAVVQSYVRLGVSETRLNGLAALLLVAAVGLLLGIWWTPIGIAAAAGTVVYFLAAIVVHLRANDTRGLTTPLALALFAAVVLILRLVTT